MVVGTLRRLFQGMATLFAVSVVTFVGTRLLPGNAATAALGRGAEPAAVRALEKELGLDRPMIVQYLDWMNGIIHGNFGYSTTGVRLSAGADALKGQLPVWDLVGPLLANSLWLMVIATILIVPLAMVVGVVSALRPGGLADNAMSIFTLVFGAVPTFVTGAVAVLVFAIHLGWFPAVSLISQTSPLGDRITALTLPVITLTLYAFAPTARMVRQSMIEVLESEYVAVARLNGVPAHRVIIRYALPNAIVPSIQVIALTIAWLAAGIVVVEAVFQLPGIGTGLTNAVSARDIPTVQFLVLLIAGVYVMVNMLADYVVVLITPRLRTGHGR